MELPNRLWTERKDLILGELDALVQGPSSFVCALLTICPIHCINKDSLIAPAPFKLVAVEVKSTVASLLSKLQAERGKEGGRGNKNKKERSLSVIFGSRHRPPLMQCIGHIVKRAVTEDEGP